MPVKQYNVFISYSHKDGSALAKLIRERIANDHRGKTITFWQDYTDMEYGNWSRQIEQAIDAVEFLVMILTPQALQSPQCKDEWMYARKQGVCVLPVNGDPGNPGFYSLLPVWMKKKHIYDLDKHWERFINDLNTSPKVEKVPFMASRLNQSDYVNRAEIIRKLKDLVLDKSENRVVSITTALQGSGGFGKTTLATALCNDDDIINSFDDGILWVTLGQQQGQTGSALQKLYQALSGEAKAFIDLEDGQQQVAERIRNKHCLVVVDDVWHRSDMEDLVKPLHSCTTLITTRFDSIVTGGNIKQVTVDNMREQEGIDLLTAPFKDKVDNVQPFKEFASILRYYPLLLKLAARQLFSRIEKGETPADALSYLKKKFERKGLTAFDLEDANKRNDSVKICLDASIELLNDSDRSRLLQLGIFPNNEDIPYSIVAQLWCMEDFDTEELLLRFHKLGLLDLNFPAKCIRMHDVLLAYFREQLPDANQYHKKFCDQLAGFSNFNSDYAWRYYIWHLQEAGETAMVAGLLQSFGWIEKKLFATDINELLKDYEYRKPGGDATVIFKALRLMAHILVEDESQLTSQIIGRLGHFDAEAIKRLVVDAEKQEVEMKTKWLKPVKPTLQAPGYLQRILKGHSSFVIGAFIHQDKIVSWSYDSTIRIWDPASGKMLRVLEERYEESIDGVLAWQNMLISWGWDISIWDFNSGKLLKLLEGHTKFVKGVIIYQDKAISWSVDKTLRIWDLATGKCLRVLEGHTDSISDAIVHGNKIISWCLYKELRVWNIDSGKYLHKLEGHTGMIRRVIAHGDRIISWDYDKTMLIWDLATGKRLDTIQGYFFDRQDELLSQHKILGKDNDNALYIWSLFPVKKLHKLQGGVSSIDGLIVHRDKLITYSYTTVYIWNLDSGECLHVLQGHLENIKGVLIHDYHIISYAKDAIRVWELFSGKLLHVLEGHSDNVLGVIVHDDKIISYSWDHTLRIWDLASGENLPAPEKHADWVYETLICNNKLVSCSKDKTLRTWDIISGKALHVLKGHTGLVSEVRIHKDKIISSSQDHTIRTWDFNTGKPVAVWNTYASAYDMIIKKDKLIGRLGGTISIWDIDSGKTIHELETSSREILGLLIHKNKIISWADDKTFFTWDLATGNFLKSLNGHSEQVYGALAHHDKIISWSGDSTIRIWDLESGKTLQVLKGHTSSVHGALVHKNTLISWSSDNTVRTWDLISGKPGHMLETYSRPESRGSLVHKNTIISWIGHECFIWNGAKGKIYKKLVYQFEIKAVVVGKNSLLIGDNSGTLELYNTHDFNLIAQYHADAAINVINVHNDPQRVIVCDQSGMIHFLEPIGFNL